MIELVIKNYWQPDITKDIGKYMYGYNMYQRIKNQTEILAEKLKLSEVLEKLQTHLMINFITKLLLVAEKDAILVVCNRLSKIMHFVAIIEETLAKRLTRLFRDNIQKLYRLPESVISDRGPHFAAELTKELNKTLEIKTKLLILFYP